MQASEDDNTIAWYRNDGNGSFNRKPAIAGPFRAHDVFAGDLDGDGDMDVLSVCMYVCMYVLRMF